MTQFVNPTRACIPELASLVINTHLPWDYTYCITFQTITISQQEFPQTNSYLTHRFGFWSVITFSALYSLVLLNGNQVSSEGWELFCVVTPMYSRHHPLERHPILCLLTSAGINFSSSSIQAVLKGQVDLNKISLPFSPPPLFLHLPFHLSARRRLYTL